MYWRPLAPRDLSAVDRIASEVHPSFPEDSAVFAERLRHSPSGCFLLVGEENGIEHPLGYMISHPWQLGRPPKLNSLLNALPAKPDTIYLHDIALLPAGRGLGMPVTALRLLRRFASSMAVDNISLVAVNESAPYWSARGFAVVDDPTLAPYLASYEPSAAYMKLMLD